MVYFHSRSQSNNNSKFKYFNIYDYIVDKLTAEIFNQNVWKSPQWIQGRKKNIISTNLIENKRKNDEILERPALTDEKLGEK